MCVRKELKLYVPEKVIARCKASKESRKKSVRISCIVYHSQVIYTYFDGTWSIKYSVSISYVISLNIENAINVRRHESCDRTC